MNTFRRQFLTSAAAVTTAFLGLHRFTQSAFGQAAPGGRGRGGSRRGPDYQNEVNRYGPLIPDPNRIFDLPKGFRYTILSRTGDVMSDGLRTPGAPDGMATFPGPNGRVI